MTVTAACDNQTATYANRQIAATRANDNKRTLNKKLSMAQEKKEDRTKKVILGKAQMAKRMGLMPQVRIRNTSSEYKLAAKLFTPNLFKIE